jgi:hypothetical protein
VLSGGNSVGDDLLYSASKRDWWFENIRFTDSAGSGKHCVYLNTCSGFVFINCAFDAASGNGVLDTNCSYNLYIRCTAYGNGSNGWLMTGSSPRLLFCSSHDNTSGTGFNTDGGHAVLFACISFDNQYGFQLSGGVQCINCVADGESDKGFYTVAMVNQWPAFLLGCRSTNHSGAGDIGVDAADYVLLTMGCYFEDNDGDNIQNATYHYNVSADGTETSSNQEDQADTNEGYTDRTEGAEDYSLNSSATARRVAIAVPLS